MGKKSIRIQIVIHGRVAGRESGGTQQVTAQNNQELSPAKLKSE